MLKIFRKIILPVVIGALIFGGQLTVRAEDADDTVDLGEIVITSSSFEEYALDYPGNVSVITREDIERSNAKYVYELLRREPGIVVRDYTHVGKTVTVDMRGFGEAGSSNVLVLVDGRRINEVDMSDTDWTQIPLENVDRIEVLRGAGSVLYGDNATAGVINIITRRGEGKPSIKAGYEYGSYRYNDYFGLVQGSHDFMSWDFFGKLERTDGYRLNGGYDGYDFMGNVSVFPADYLKLNFSGGYHKDWYGLPGGLQCSEIDRIGRRGSTTPNDIAKTESAFLRASPEVSFDIGNSEHVVSLDAWGRKRRNNSAFPSMAFLTKSQIDSAGGSARYLLGNDFDSVKNKLTLGVDLFSAKNRLRSQGWTTDQLHITKETLGIFIADKAEIMDKFILNGGFRQEWAEYRFVQWSAATRHERKFPVQQAFDIGGELKYSEAGAVYSRFSRSYRYPKTDEFFSTFSGLNTNLKPQIAYTWEAGIKEHSLKYFTVDGGFFFMDLNNEIYYNPATFTNANYHHTQRKGVEVAARSEVTDVLDLFFGYTYTNAYFVGSDFPGHIVPQVPRHKINWGITFTPVSWLEFNFNSEYVSSQYHISDQRNQASKLKSYMNCNGKVAVLYKGLRAFFGVNNIFNQQYSERSVTNATATVIDFYPAPGINYEFGVSWEI